MAFFCHFPISSQHLVVQKHLDNRSTLGIRAYVEAVRGHTHRHQHHCDASRENRRLGRGAATMAEDPKDALNVATKGWLHPAGFRGLEV